MCRKLICLVLVIVLVLLADMANADITTDLMGYWKLDDNANDSSGNNYHGEEFGSPSYVPGVIDQAMDFDGPEQSVYIPDFTAVQNQDAVTVCMWVKADRNTGADQVMWFTDEDGSYGRVRFGINGDEWEWKHGGDGANPNVDDGENPIILGEWTHLAGVRQNRVKLELFVNGISVDQTAFGVAGVAEPQASIGSERRSPTSVRDPFDGVIDEVRFYTRALSAADIQELFTFTGAPPKFASNPNPADEATDVPRDVVLSWTPGDFAPAVNGHKVFLSDNFNDVNESLVAADQGTRSNPEFDTATLPIALEFSTTYYWRVDEANSVSGWDQGDVWSFTVEPFAYPIDGTSITATASSSNKAEEGPENTINRSGLDDNDLHSDDSKAMWLSSMIGPQPTWIQYELDQVYKLHQMLVWNHNSSVEPIIGFGIKDATIDYSTDGANWTTLGTTHEFAKALGEAGYAPNTTVDLGGAVAKYVKITANSNWGGIVTQYGLSEVRFFYVPVLAREPDPAPGTADVSVGTIDEPIDVTLSFRAGREAASHNLYFSDSWQAVTDGTAPVNTLSQASHGPLSLDLGKIYYWRVDEVNEAETPATWQGDIWDFTTQQYFVVDDFEDYNDFEPDRIFDTWIDGWGVPTNGSQVGSAEPPFAEQTVVHGGKQSMPINYDNTAGVTYSEAERIFASPQDWTFKGAKELTLWFRGNPVAFLESPAGTFTMSADGVDIWGTADEFRFAYKQLSGDGSITATVNSILWVTGSNDWSKGGVMIRDTLDAGAKNAFTALSTGAGDGATFQWRPTTGSSSSSSRTLVGISPPAAVRLVRQGDTFTGYVFLNGQWQQEGQAATVTMGNTVYIGMALTSHSTGVITEAVFSDVTTTGTVTGQWQVAEIGGTHPSNTASSLYVALSDSANKTATVKYPDSGATTIGAWTEWNIELSQFTGVNPRSIKKIIIGVGDKANPQVASGVVYFDDIRLYPHREPPVEIWFEAEAADITGASWRVIDDPNASGGKYIGSENGDGDDFDFAPGPAWVAVYNFTIETDGAYKVLLRGQEADSDSFWVRIPSATSQNHEDPDQPGKGWVMFNGMDAPSGWAWDEVHSNDHSNAVVNWRLHAGAQTLEIAKREDGVYLDAILVTSNLELDQATLPSVIPQAPAGP